MATNRVDDGSAKVAESGLTQRPAEPPIAGSNPALGFSRLYVDPDAFDRDAAANAPT